MSHPSQHPRADGAHSLGETPRKKRPLWLWALLALVLLGLLLLLLSRCGSDSDKAASGGAATSSPTPSASSDSSAPSSPSASPSTATTPGTSSAGQLTVAGAPLLGAGASATTGSLGKYVGKSAEAQGVEVQSVPADEGFWVGSSSTNRAWVELRGTNESGYQVREGDKVEFTGTVVEHGSDFPGTVGVSGPEGAAQLVKEKAHIVVRQSELKQSTD